MPMLDRPTVLKKERPRRHQPMRRIRNDLTLGDFSKALAVVFWSTHLLRTLYEPVH
jgi:hypothetical protein